MVEYRLVSKTCTKTYQSITIRVGYTVITAVNVLPKATPTEEREILKNTPRNITMKSSNSAGHKQEAPNWNLTRNGKSRRMVRWTKKELEILVIGQTKLYNKKL